MRHRPLLLATLVLALIGPAAQAQSSAENTAFQAFGARPGLVSLMDDFMVRLLADPRTGPFFQKANQAHVKQQLVDQFCQALGGPCAYEGLDMKSAHQDLEIRKREFNALVEILQAAMAARGIPFAAQNQLLVRLAPLHRDIVTVH
ncbi:group 1 truncated hemoglobin [Aquabacterium sp.]|uniref:group I truncated hemoglobin n=1 Tax=Aquabacterium sp. TaxID=1872578 RepID=UPI003784BD20